MVGLCTGPIKQELSRQIRRDEHMTFSAVCKEARALEHELQEGEDSILSQRITAPTPRDFIADLEALKGQIRTELQQGLMGEMKEQMKTLSASLMEEVKAHLASREMPPVSHVQPVEDRVAPAPSARIRQQPAVTSSYQWDAQGRPICRNCGEAGHVQRRCPRRPSGRRDF